MAGWCRAVGWNCMNSTSATATPARRAMASPSPVASAGLVVTAKSCPLRRWRARCGSARTSTTRPSALEGTHPPAPAALHHQVQGEPLLHHGRGRWPGWRRPGPARPRRRWPRRRRGPPVPWSGHLRGPVPGPPGCRSNTAPMAISSWTRAGPSSTSTRTASASHRPAPAARVSARWRSVESSSPPSTAATPPWAQRVADWDSSALVSTPTRRPSRRAGGSGRGQRRGQPHGRRQVRPRRCRAPGRRAARGRHRPARPGQCSGRGSRLSMSRTGPTVAAMISRSAAVTVDRAGSRSAASTSAA